MGLKTIKIEWDLCSNPPWVWFYHYTMFLNPMPQPSCQKSRKTIITQKVLVRQSSHIVTLWLACQKPICTDFQAFLYTFSLYKLTFFHFFFWWSEANSQKFHILLILTGKNALKWLEWCVFRVWDVPNPMVQVSSLYNKWFLKNPNLGDK